MEDRPRPSAGSIDSGSAETACQNRTLLHFVAVAVVETPVAVAAAAAAFAFVVVVLAGAFSLGNASLARIFVPELAPVEADGSSSCSFAGAKSVPHPA